MDILERINELRKQKNWSVYKLAEESGITQSTLANMFARKTQPSISTLLQLCSGFNISIGEFFCESANISGEDEVFLAKFRKLSDKNKDLTIKIMKLLESEKE